MALTTSIYLDDEDLRSTYGIEILAVDDPWGTARFAASLLDVPLRDGSILTRGKFEPRRIVLKGYIKAASHAALMTALDALKTKIHPQGEGLGKVRLKFADTTDRWFRGYFENIKVGPPFKAWRIAAAVNIELPFVCLEAMIEGDEVDVEQFTALGTKDSFVYTNSGSAITYPLIVVRNVEMGFEPSTFILRNLAVIQRKRIITPTLAGNVLRRMGNPTWSGGSYLGAVYSTVADSSSIRFPTAGIFTPRAFSVLMWIYRTFSSSSENEHFFLCNNDESFKIWRDGNGLNSDINFTLDAVTVSLSQDLLTQNAWVPVIATYDGTSMYLYVGTGTSQEGEKTDFNTVGTYLFVGCDSSSAKQAESRFDEVRLINRAITSGEITEWKAMDSPMPMHKGTTLYLPCDEDLNALAWEQTVLTIANTLALAEQWFIDTKNLTIQKGSPYDHFGTLTDIIGDASGEFPFLVSGLNNFQVEHDGIEVDIIIQNRPRYL